MKNFNILPTVLLFVSFLGIVVFGFVSMGHDGGGCIAALARGVNCPEHDNALQSIQFHLGAFEYFILADLGVFLSFMIILTFLALAFAVSILKILFQDSASLPVPFFRLSQRPISQVAPAQRQFIEWFSLRENSPVSL